jgi:hypothetical protein
MNFNLVSKNNMGVVMTLILAVLLSQSRFFDFLIDAALGRSFLLVFVIFIAYTNKILGLVAVLFVIIAFNNNDMNMVYSYNYYEGFDGSGNQTANAIMQDKLTILQAKENLLQNKINAVQQKANNQSQNSTNSSTTATTTSSSVSGTESFKGREGFCMTDRESNMLRGKQSNAVPVFNNLREQSDDVSPTDKSVFTSEYASV